MSFTRDTSRSVRWNIIEELRQRFLAVDPSKTEYADFEVRWNEVTRSPIADYGSIMGDTLVIIDTRETKERNVGYITGTIETATEFHTCSQYGDDPQTSLDVLMNEVQRVVLQDIQCDGLCSNIQEIRNEYDIDGQNDKVLSGIIFWRITYTHSLTDTRKLRGE